MLIRTVEQATHQLRDLEGDARHLTHLQVAGRARSIRKLLERALAREKRRERQRTGDTPRGDE